MTKTDLRRKAIKSSRKRNVIIIHPRYTIKRGRLEECVLTKEGTAYPKAQREKRSCSVEEIEIIQLAGA